MGQRGRREGTQEPPLCSPPAFQRPALPKPIRRHRAKEQGEEVCRQPPGAGQRSEKNASEWVGWGADG